jgi:predicted transcriptional regulator
MCFANMSPRVKMPAMRTSKTRHQFYLPDVLSAKLDALADKPGTSKTAILSDALTAWLDRAGAQEVEERFGPRFDRLSRCIERAEQKIDVLIETLGLFVHHQMTLTAHQPPFDRETAQLGLDRYQRFTDQVGRRLAQRHGSVAGISKSKEEI